MDSVSRLRRHVPAQYLLPVLLLLGACFGCILVVLSSTTRTQDALQEQRERQSLERAITISTEMVSHDLQDYAKWDDAVRHVVQEFDSEWVDDNITAYLGKTQGYSHIFVVDGADRTIYAYSHDGIPRREAGAVLGSDFSHAVASVRRAHHDEERILSGFTRSGGTLYLYSVAAIVPLTGKIELAPGPTHIVTIAQRIDAPFLAKIAHDQGLRAVRLGASAHGIGRAVVPLEGVGGDAIAWIGWRPNRPGTALLRTVLPVFSGVALVALIAAWLILRRGGRTIEALRESEALAHHHACHDSLTGLPNRRVLQACIQEALVERITLTLLYMDLDGFKDANDVYGHAAGDALLREAAARIRTAAGGEMIARAGGDEFAVLVARPEPDAAERIATAILDQFHRPFAIGAYSISVGISIGSAALDAGGRGGENELMRRADVAMYAAKGDGKNCWRTYAPLMDRGHDLRVTMEADLREAIDAGGIRVLFQPIVEAQSAAIVAVEALARWSHPVHGQVSPDVFIPLAEMSGMISALGRHVLTRACTEGRDLGVDVAVNLSPAQFWDKALARDIHAVLTATDFPPERLELEITERYLLTRPEAAATIIEELRAMGVRVALDDFGTGYASLGYLRQLKFDRLKVDKGFIQPLGTDPQAAELLASIVALARALDLEITAEGVEGEMQADIARLAGCTRLQGWLYGRPTSVSEIRAALHLPVRADLELAADV